MALSGESTVDIAAPAARCFEIAADLERAHEWQGSLQSVEVLERDHRGLAVVVETVSDAKVKTIRSRLRFAYEPDTAITWSQEKGDVKSLHGRWFFEQLSDARTRATYRLEVDPGRILGMLIRGPAEDRVRQVLVGDAADGLKARAEAG
jgi:ribosome-associated toxin RatA of RatAB toxin-antitoxin module